MKLIFSKKQQSNFSCSLLFKLSLFSLIFTLTKSQDEYVGMRTAVKLSTLKEFQTHFFIDFIDELQKFQIQNQSFDYPVAGVSNAKIKIEDIKLNLVFLKSDNINISFENSNTIKLKGSNMKADGRFKLKIKVGILPEFETTVTI